MWMRVAKNASTMTLRHGFILRFQLSSKIIVPISQMYEHSRERVFAFPESAAGTAIGGSWRGVQ